MSEMNGIRGKIKGAFDLNDEQVERLLQGHTSVDPMLASLLAQLRTLAKPPSTELAESHIQMLVEAARDTSSSVGLDENPGLLRRRLGTRAAAIAFALLLLGAGVAAAATGTLPAPAQKVIADLVSQVGIEIPGADQETGDVVDTADVDVQGVSENAHQFVDAVQQAVRDYTEALETWVACVVENSAPACPDKVLAGHHADLAAPRTFGIDPKTGRAFHFPSTLSGGGWGALPAPGPEEATCLGC